MAVKKGGLGRGLNSLFEENAAGEDSAVQLRLSEIEPNRDQPRKDFDSAALQELSDSIRTHGVLQPLLVRPMPGGGYQIVAGERRWRASRMAGLETVPAVVRELSDSDAMQLALIENLQREDLNPVEEALGYRALIDEFGFTQETVAEKVGKSRPAVTNALRLLGLGDDLLKLVRQGEISAGHGRAILSIGDPGQKQKAVELAVKGASVREIERLARQGKTGLRSKTAKSKDGFYSEVELALSAEIGRRVKIIPGKDKGILQVEFYNKQELADMVSRIAGEKW